MECFTAPKRLIVSDTQELRLLASDGHAALSVLNDGDSIYAIEQLWATSGIAGPIVQPVDEALNLLLAAVETPGLGILLNLLEGLI